MTVVPDAMVSPAPFGSARFSPSSSIRTVPFHGWPKAFVLGVAPVWL